MSLHKLNLALERRAYTALRSFADRKSRKPLHLLVGERGEDAAFFHLRGLGYTIVARRWRTERLRGDLDLVAWDGPTLVVFEVKTRTAQDFASAASAVDDRKKKMLRKMASAYLRQIPGVRYVSLSVRFDILSVYMLPAGTEFEHIADAFPRSESTGARGRW
jgi:putative endonuclease